jgi:hypothetical protein
MQLFLEKVSRGKSSASNGKNKMIRIQFCRLTSRSLALTWATEAAKSTMAMATKETRILVANITGMTGIFDWIKAVLKTSVSTGRAAEL